MLDSELHQWQSLWWKGWLCALEYRDPEREPLERSFKRTQVPSPSRSARAPTFKAVRGTVAKEIICSIPRAVHSPLRVHPFPLQGHLFPLQAASERATAEARDSHSEFWRTDFFAACGGEALHEAFAHPLACHVSTLPAPPSEGSKHVSGGCVAMCISLSLSGILSGLKRGRFFTFSWSILC